MKRTVDNEYIPEEAATTNIKNTNTTTNKTTKKKKGNNTNTFLDENSKQIISLHHSGSKPKDIASALCLSKSLKPGSITGKQVSSWIGYRKLSGQIKTRPVSLENKNLKVDFSDDCMC